MHSASGQLDADDSNRFVTQMEWALEEQPGVDGLLEYEGSANIVPFEDLLEAAVAEGRFRADLFYRLNVFPLEMPALRDRRADISVLVEYFIHRYARRAGKRVHSITKTSLDLLKSYGWPGNVRELQNVVERAVIVSDSETLSIDERWLSARSAAPREAVSRHLPTLASRERDAIETALVQTKGRVAGPFGATERLGVPSSTLESKIRAMKIDKRRYKGPQPDQLG